MAGQPTRQSRTPPPRNTGLIFGLIKGNQMVKKPLIRPYKTLFLGGVYVGGGWLVDQPLELVFVSGFFKTIRTIVNH